MLPAPTHADAHPDDGATPAAAPLRRGRATSARVASVKEAKLAASQAQRAATQRHLDERRARHEAHAAALASALGAAAARAPGGRAVAELTRQLAEARRRVAAVQPAMLPAPVAAPPAAAAPTSDGGRR